jgi:hypothetical protein
MTKLVQFYVLILHVPLLKILQEQSLITGRRGAERGDCKATYKNQSRVPVLIFVHSVFDGLGSLKVWRTTASYRWEGFLFFV